MTNHTHPPPPPSLLLPLSSFSLPKTTFLLGTFDALLPNCIEKIYSGAFQLLQLQEDIRRQFKMDGSAPENDVESHVRLNKDTLMNSLWKLNVVDIEVTLIHVCQMVISLFPPIN